MKIHLHISSIPVMLTFLDDLKNGKANREQLVDLFNHLDYVYEFNRYNVSSKDEIIKYFLTMNSIAETEIPVLSSDRKTTLKDKHSLWLSAYENPKKFEARYDKMHSFITEASIESIIQRCKAGLPENIDIDDVNIISTMSIGMSFGYVFDGALHFDIMQLDDFDNLSSMLAHEIHHLAMWNFASEFIDKLTLEERYIFNFSGEGLAIKFCNNAKGRFSKPIYSQTAINEGLDEFSMNYLNNRFEESWTIFEETLADIRIGKMSKEDVFKQIEDYWWNPYAEGQKENEAPLLKQSRMYSFGNDLYGSIYDVYGSDVLFDCVRHPLKALECFRSIYAL